MNERLRQAYNLHQKGEFDQAAQIYRDILAADANNYDAHYLLGFIHLQRGQFDLADQWILKALKLNPRSVDALYARGRALMKLQRFEEAIASFDAALALHPRIFEANVARADSLSALGRMAEALAGFDRAIALKPNIAEVWNNRGTTLMNLARPVDALASFERASAFNPNLAEVWNNRGNALTELSRPEEALQNYDRALAIRPDFLDTWNNRGNALAALKRFEEALACYDRVLAARPGNADALDRAITFFELKRYEDAAHDFAAIAKADPDFPYATGNLLYSRLHACDWRGLDEAQADLAAGLKNGRPVLTPIQSTVVLPRPDDQLHCARIWAADKYPVLANPLWRGERYNHDRIRVAYLSADFHSHATAALMAGVFEHHDRSHFQTAAVSYGPDDRSPMRARLRAAFEVFHDVRGRSDTEIAVLLRQMEVDIAVDLKGYTQDARPGILSHRAAPVQAHYLGFPGTMGTGVIDYIIADCVVLPPDHQDFYDEKPAYLPDTYQCNDSKRSIAENTISRADAGLPDTGFVFCCFNNNFKIAPEAFGVWMRLLKAIEGSVLWLLEDNPAAARNLRREAAARGISSDRLVFASRTGLEVHLARHRLVDLFLDTLPYTAHTTASDALWAGLPVLTCLGGIFAGRVAASLLLAVGLPELVTESWGAYEALALQLARDSARLAAIKAKLAAHRGTHPLFDTARFTRHLETAYVMMHERHGQGLAPAALFVPPSP